MASNKFIRTSAHKKKRMAPGWRKPKGLQNKKRLQLKNHGINVKPGYRKPKTTRGKSKELEIISTTSLELLKLMDKKTQAVLIGRTGKKKKLEIIAEAEKLGIQIVNLNTENYKENASKFLEERKKAVNVRNKKQQDKKQQELEKEKAEKEKKAKKDEEKDSQKAELTPEEKQKKEKEEKDKILTKPTTKTK